MEIESEPLELIKGEAEEVVSEWRDEYSDPILPTYEQTSEFNSQHDIELQDLTEEIVDFHNELFRMDIDNEEVSASTKSSVKLSEWPSRLNALDGVIAASIPINTGITAFATNFGVVNGLALSTGLAVGASYFYNYNMFGGSYSDEEKEIRIDGDLADVKIASQAASEIFHYFQHEANSPTVNDYFLLEGMDRSTKTKFFEEKSEEGELWNRLYLENKCQIFLGGVVAASRMQEGYTIQQGLEEVGLEEGEISENPRIEAWASTFRSFLPGVDRPERFGSSNHWDDNFAYDLPAAVIYNDVKQTSTSFNDILRGNNEPVKTYLDGLKTELPLDQKFIKAVGGYD